MDDMTNKAPDFKPNDEPDKSKSKLAIWQERLGDSDSAYSSQVSLMDSREELYNGQHQLKPITEGDTTKEGSARTTSHCRNIIFENIETQISSSIPQPKVTPRNKGDEHLANIIEHFLRNELDRLPFETINDMAERTVPIQGAVGFLVDWDNTRRTHNTIGEVTVSVIHPKQFAPQPAVYTGIDDMDWFIVKVPTTKGAIRRLYGKDVYAEGESEPEIRSAGGHAQSEDAVTMYVGFELNDSGSIDKYIWVNNVELEDLEDYQARRQPVCKSCGRVRPLPGQIINAGVPHSFNAPATEDTQAEDAAQMLASQLAAAFMTPQPEDATSVQPSIEPQQPDVPPSLSKIPFEAGDTPPDKYDGGPCPWCGGTEFSDEVQEYEEVMVPMNTPGGVQIPGSQLTIGEDGTPVEKPTLIPFYKPDVYPIVLQRSVSVYGQLLGNSDVDVIADQQNTVNRIELKIIDRLVKAGTRVTLPDSPNFRIDSEDYCKWYIKNPADKAMIDVIDFKGDLQYELMYLNQVYEEARQILGITDSYQGRTDKTATSAVAKQFSAAQAAGRLESKRVMKDAAYASIFELMFKFWLAYGDEPRPVNYKDPNGDTVYEEFNRYDFLKQDPDGTWYWNDQFLFSCDSSAPLASNREAMWQETRLNLQTGAFGDPTSTDTLILFWSKMEMLHYPGAAETKKFLEERLEQELRAAQEQAQAEAQAQAQAQMPQQPQQQGEPFMGDRTALGLDPRILLEIDRQAERDAINSASGNNLKAERAGGRERGLY